MTKHQPAHDQRGPRASLETPGPSSRPYRLPPSLLSEQQEILGNGLSPHFVNSYLQWLGNPPIDFGPLDEDTFSISPHLMNSYLQRLGHPPIKFGPLDEHTFSTATQASTRRQAHSLEAQETPLPSQGTSSRPSPHLINEYLQYLGYSPIDLRPLDEDTPTQAPKRRRANSHEPQQIPSPPPPPTSWPIPHQAAGIIRMDAKSARKDSNSLTDRVLKTLGICPEKSSFEEIVEREPDEGRDRTEQLFHDILNALAISEEDSRLEKYEPVTEDTATQASELRYDPRNGRWEIYPQSNALSARRRGKMPAVDIVEQRQR